MNQKEHYIDNIEKQMKDWKVQIENLASKAYGADEQGGSELQNNLNSLQEKHRQSELKLEELKAASEESLEDLKTGYEKLRDDIEESIRNAQSSLS